MVLDTRRAPVATWIAIALERWTDLVHDPMPVATSNEISCIRAVIRIDAALRNSAAHATRPARWLKSLQMSPPFGGRTPLALMFRGPEQLAAVADYLESRR